MQDKLRIGIFHIEKKTYSQKYAVASYLEENVLFSFEPHRAK